MSDMKSIADRIMDGPYHAAQPGAYADSDGKSIVILGDNRSVRLAVIHGDDDEAMAHAQLLVEALAVAKTSGMTPCQLLQTISANQSPPPAAPAAVIVTVGGIGEPLQPGIDLEQFRDAVKRARDGMWSGCPDTYQQDVPVLDRLLAMIDGQANVRSSSEHSEPALIDRQAEQRPLIARQLAEWHEDDGPAMWWAWCGSDWAGEPAWCGTPNDSDWPGYHTHWTPHPAWPMQPKERGHG